MKGKLLNKSFRINNLFAQCRSLSFSAFRILTLILLLSPITDCISAEVKPITERDIINRHETMPRTGYIALKVKHVPVGYCINRIEVRPITGCIPGKKKHECFISNYQESLAAKGPQQRTGAGGLAPITVAQNPDLAKLEEKKDPNGKTIINLSLENAVLRALSNSPEITVVSYDPSIAEEGISAAASKFDVTAFGQLGYDKKDLVSNNLSESGMSSSGLWEVGLKKKAITGAEWLLSYAMTRTADESISRIFSTSYEPTVTFKLKQPLLRDAWPDINLAGVDIAKLNYRTALASFLQKSQDVSTQVISLYWTLLQARRDMEIQQDLLDKAFETLRKVEGRKEIDATVGDIKHAEATVKRREAVLLDSKKWFSDVQDSMVRLLSDQQMQLIDSLEIIPSTAPDNEASKLDQSELLKTALENNPEIMRAQLEADVAKINMTVAKRQKMPRLDIVASTQVQGFSNDKGEAGNMLSDGDYNSYSLGMIFEYPLGNREKKSEFRISQLKYAKALSKLHNVSDQAAEQVKERIRFTETSHKKIQIQKDTVNAARIHLQTLEDIETIRAKMTPEFLFAKIQAQEAVADAQRSEIKAIVDYNIALATLAQAVGNVWDLRYLKQYRQSLIAAE